MILYSLGLFHDNPRMSRKLSLLIQGSFWGEGGSIKLLRFQLIEPWYLLHFSKLVVGPDFYPHRLDLNSKKKANDDSLLPFFTSSFLDYLLHGLVPKGTPLKAHDVSPCFSNPPNREIQRKLYLAKSDSASRDSRFPNLWVRE